MQASIYLKGIDQLERQANNLIKAVNKEKAQLLLNQARIVRNRVRSKAPKGATGNLKRAVYATVLKPSLDQPVVAFAGIRPRRAPHAHLVEYGHGGPHAAPPHPFFRPAWDEVRDKVLANIKNGVKKAVGKAS